jgi:hypothetical protein
MQTSMRVIVASFTAALLGTGSAHAQTFNSGSTGALGPLNVTGGTVTLTTPLDGIFHYTTINISGFATVRFTRNAGNTPITLLATGDVTLVNATIDISGGNGAVAGFGQTFLTANGGASGPGGFNGGSGANGLVSTTGGAGLGPGGGGGSTVVNGATNQRGAGGGGFATAGIATSAGTQGTAGVAGPAYGATSLLPLIGGSGGGGGGAIFGNTGGGGGGGGGAIVIASSGTLTLSGGAAAINARGGAAGDSFASGGVASGAGGSGGAVRLAATSVTGNFAQILVAGGAGTSTSGGGGAGRIRVEAFNNTLGATFPSVPPAVVTSAPPTTVALASAPTLRITSVGGVSTPVTPAGSLSNPDVTLPAGTTNPVAVGIAASNVPIGTVITVAVAGQYGSASSAASGGLSGTVASSTASATVSIPLDQPSIVSATATFAVADLGGEALHADGEPVERVRVATTTTGLSRVTYITRSGREVPIPR